MKRFASRGQVIYKSWRECWTACNEAQHLPCFRVKKESSGFIAARDVIGDIGVTDEPNCPGLVFRLVLVATDRLVIPISFELDVAADVSDTGRPNRLSDDLQFSFRRRVEYDRSLSGAAVRFHVLADVQAPDFCVLQVASMQKPTSCKLADKSKSMKHPVGMQSEPESLRMCFV